jgi:hypothetical protein
LRQPSERARQFFRPLWANHSTNTEQTMKLKWVGLLAAISLLHAGAATAAPEAAHVRAVMILDGSCRKLVLPGHDLTQGCDGRLVNEVYSNGRVGFTFVLTPGPIVSFSGIAPQVKQGPDAAIQPIDMVIWGFNSRPVRPIPNRVVGRCRFTNPYKGQATVSCRATAKDGEYSAEFVTDGSPPTERTF